MSDQPAIIGVQKCGCVTFAHARPASISREDLKAMDEIRKADGKIVMTTVNKARRRKHFLPAECPHQPKGWTPMEIGK